MKWLTIGLFALPPLLAEESTRSAQLVPFSAGKLKHFREVSELTLPYGEPHDVVVSGDRLVVANGVGGVLVLRSKGRELELLGRYITAARPNVGLVREAYRGEHGLAATVVAVRGNLVFAACSAAKRFWDAYTLILALDISDPREIKALGCYPYGGVGKNPFRRAELKGERLLLHSDASLKAIDISDIGRMKPLPLFEGADKKKNYVAAETRDGRVCAATRAGELICYQRQEDGKLKLTTSLKLPGTIHDAAFVGPKLVFLFDPASEGEVGLFYADFADEPKLTGHVRLGNQPRRMTLAGDRAYVLDHGGDLDCVGLRETGPELLDRWRLGQGKGFAVDSGRAFLCLPGRGVRSYKLGKKVRSRLLSLERTAGEVVDLTEADGLIYAAGGVGGLHIVRREGPGLRRVATYRTRGPATRVCVVSGTAFIAERAAGLEVVDVSRPDSPKLLGSYQPDGEVWDVCVDGRYAYLAVDNVGLEVLDISYPKLPIRAAAVETEGTKRGKYDDKSKEKWVDRTNPRGIAVRDGIAYLANGRGGMLAFDVKNPLKPRRLRSSFFDQATGRMSSVRVGIHNDSLLLSDQDNGVYLFDLAKPAAPKLVSSFRTGMANNSVAAGPFLYVADGAYGLRAINVRDPKKPSYAGSYHAPRIQFNDLILDGGQLVVADAGGLKLFEVREREDVRGTAFRLGADGKDRPLLKRDGTPVKLAEVPGLYGKADGFAIYDGDVEVCSPQYAGHGGPEGQKRPIGMDLSDKAGFPDIRVPADRVAIDPALGRLKFSDGDRDPMKRVGLQLLPMGIPDGLVRTGNLLCQSNDEGWNLIVYDISKPTEPVRTAVAATGGFSHPITASGKRCFVHNNIQGYTVFDLADKFKPKVLGFVHGLRGAQAGGDGRYLYSGKEIWDVSKPVSPKKIADMPERELFSAKTTYPAADGKLEKTSATPYLVAGDRLFLLSKAEGLEIWDFGDATSPRRLGRCDALPGLMAFDEPGKLLFVLTGSKTVSVFDVSDPAKPVRSGGAELARKIGGRIAASNKVLYAVGKHFDVVDATNPRRPRLRGRIENKVNGHWENYTAVVGGAPGVAYVVYGSIGLIVIDVSNLDKPKWSKKLYTNGGDFSAPGVLTRDGVAYVFSNWNGVSIVDVSKPEKPELLSMTRRFMEPSPIGEARGCGGAALHDRFLYTTSMFLKYLNVFDVSNPAAPRLAFQLERPKRPGGYYELPYVSDGRLYLGAGHVVYDLSKPDKPELLHSDEKLGPFNMANFVSGGRRYAGDGRLGLRITDVTDPSNQKTLGELPGSWVDSHYFDNPVYLKGDLLFTCSGVPGGFFHVVDVSDATKPRWLGSCEMAGIPCGVEVRGSLAYVADYYGSLQVVDVSDPTAPCLVDYWGEGAFGDTAFWDDVACIQSIWIDGDYGYATEYYSGLHILDVPRSSQAPQGNVTVRVPQP